MENLTSILIKSLEKYDLPETFYLDVVRAAWPEIVGTYLSQKLFLGSIRGMKLTVIVGDVRLLEKMNRAMVSREIRKKIAALLPGLIVKSIGFTAGKIPSPEKRDAPPASLKLPAKLPGFLLDAAASIQNAGLRRRFLEAAGKGLAVAMMKEKE